MRVPRWRTRGLSPKKGPDGLDDAPALLRVPDVEGMRSVVHPVLFQLDGLPHPPDGSVPLEDGHRAAQLGKPPRRRYSRRPRSKDRDVLQGPRPAGFLATTK